MVEMLSKLCLGLTVILLLVIEKPEASFFNQTTHVVPWTVLPGIALPYRIWSSVQRFSVNDNVVFVFVPGLHTVAEVTKEGFDRCNSADIISVEAASPATFNVESAGTHYYICTVSDHCTMGQKVAITVPESQSPPQATPAALNPSGRDASNIEAYTAHIVGDDFGWAPSSAGASDYTAWASNRTFLVGDTLVFKFVDELQDVALVKKSAYQNCDTSNNNIIALFSKSPATVPLNSTGDYYFTTTNSHICKFGQQLAINVRPRTPPAPQL